MKESAKKRLRLLIPLLIVAVGLINVIFFMEFELRGTLCFYRHFYPTPWEAMDRGGVVDYQLIAYGLDADTPVETFQVDESNALCVFLCQEVLVLQEMYCKEGGFRPTGSQLTLDYRDVTKNTELGSLAYTELWLILPDGHYGQKCSYALRSAHAEAPAGARVFPLQVQGETWDLILTDPQ